MSTQNQSVAPSGNSLITAVYEAAAGLGESTVRFCETLGRSVAAAREYERLTNQADFGTRKGKDTHEAVARHVMEKYLAF